jgi:hypothetical protein
MTTTVSLSVAALTIDCTDPAALTFRLGHPHAEGVGGMSLYPPDVVLACPNWSIGDGMPH